MQYKITTEKKSGERPKINYRELNYKRLGPSSYEVRVDYQKMA